MPYSPGFSPFGRSSMAAPPPDLAAGVISSNPQMANMYGGLTNPPPPPQITSGPAPMNVPDEPKPAAAPPTPTKIPEPPAPAPAPQPAPAPPPQAAAPGPAMGALDRLDMGKGWETVSEPSQTRLGLGQRLNQQQQQVFGGRIY